MVKLPRKFLTGLGDTGSRTRAFNTRKYLEDEECNKPYFIEIDPKNEKMNIKNLKKSDLEDNDDE